MCCVVCGVVCGVVCVFLLSVRAGGVLFKTRTQSRSIGKKQKLKKINIIIILAKCPNTVWVLHHEKVVLGVALSCYVVLGSRVVLCFVNLKSIGNPGFGGRM